MMKAVIFIGGGGGLGVATRSIFFGEILSKEGFDVVYASSGRCFNYIKKKKLRVHSVSPEMTFALSDGKLDPRKTTINYIRNISRYDMSELNKIMDEENPDIVISDSYLPGALAGIIKGKLTYPVLSFINTQLHNDELLRLNLGNRIVWGIWKIVFSRCKRLIIPDFPPPNTIC
ncbi:MAG: hypothetical protein KKD39_02125 [Candidatus Altiarchaeota archaeon]|nr:hypothetical protein [Candidatus Altiarchaeota archaeon]